MENKNIIKGCQNCKYFSQHYSKQRLKFKKAECGHCINTNRTIRRKLVLCELWEMKESKDEESKLTIEKVMSKMAKDLKEIAIFLKYDNE